MHYSTDEPLRLCLFGAGPGTGNLGVSALGLAVLAGIARRASSPLVTVFDNGRGVRPAHAEIAGRRLTYRLCGAVPTRRLYRRDSVWRIRASGWLGGLGHEAITLLRESHAILDGTSGDSFTDIYRGRRLHAVTAEKLLILEQDRPLLLLPQTIGPFETPAGRRVAKHILGSARTVWTRDQQSLAAVAALLGAAFDPARHRCGVDLAFLLEEREPARAIPGPAGGWLARAGGAPLVGFNVSGLLANRPDASRRRFGLCGDYREAVTLFLGRLLRETDADVLLVPHVFSRPGHFEHDPDACAAVLAALGARAEGRVAILPEGLDAGETKWVIGRTSWFCATRMHAGIAAISSGVPAAAIAYSRKTRGVFETAGQGEHVAELHRLGTDDVVEGLWRWWLARDDARAALRRTLPTVRWQAEAQMDEIVGTCIDAREERAARRMAGEFERSAAPSGRTLALVRGGGFIRRR